MTETKSPQWHYEEAERLLLAANTLTESDTRLPLCFAEAQVHATLALAGFTRDGAIEQHTHEYMLPNGLLRETEAGRPA